MDRIEAPQQPIATPHVALYRRIATAFLLLTVGVILLVVYVVFAKATVVVLSEQQEVKADLLIDVARKPGPGEVLGEVIEVADTAEQSFPSTSLVKIDVPAEGRVRISSTLFRPQTLIATTRLLTPDGVLFRIRETVVVPAHGSVEVEAFADQPGKTGAVGNTTFTIPGLNEQSRTFFTVETVEPIVGGVKDVKMVTKQDVEAATKVLEEKLGTGLTAKLRTTASEGGAPTSGEFISVETTSAITDVPIGAEADSFTLKVRVSATGVFYDKDQFDERVRATLKDKIPLDKQLIEVKQDGTTLAVEKRDLISGRANVRVEAKGTAILSPNAPQLDPSKLVGISADAAREYVEGLEGVASASVRVRPFWAGRMPNVADNIRIEVR